MGLIFKKGINLQEMITSADTRDIFNQAINTYLYDMKEAATYDGQWAEIFEEFETDKESEKFPKGPKFAVTFTAVSEGQPPKFGSVSDGTDVNIDVVHYRAALRYSKDWFRYNKIPLIEKATQGFRDGAANAVDSVYYGILNNAASQGTTAGANTAIAVGDAINEQVVAMVTPGTDSNGNPDMTNVCFPTHILCNDADESLAKAALDATLRREITYRDKTVKPLNSRTTSLKTITSPRIPSGRLLIVEAKRYWVRLKDGELELDQEDDKMFDAENMYGSLRFGGACLSSNAIRYVDLP